MNTHAAHDIIAYIKAHPLIVLGTVDINGHPCGAAVYAYAKSAETLYFVTKSDTQKYRNIQHTPYVSVTIAHAENNSTLQATGRAVTVENPDVIGDVMENMAEIYSHSADWLPPIAKISAGPYEVVEITLTSARLAEYKDKLAGSPHIFKEL